MNQVYCVQYKNIIRKKEKLLRVSQKCRAFYYLLTTSFDHKSSSGYKKF